MTNLSDLGGIVCVDGRAGEDIISAIADGSTVAGEMVSVIGTPNGTTADIAPTAVGGIDQFVGIVLPKYNVDCDTAVGNGKVVEVVRPQSGHKYNVQVVDPTGAKEIGEGLTFGGTAGFLDFTVTDVEAVKVARNTKFYVDAVGATVIEVLWVM